MKTQLPAIGVLAAVIVSPAAAQAGTARGRVVDSKNKPVPHLAVRVWDTGGGPRKLMGHGLTDTDGRFAVEYADDWREGTNAFGNGGLPDVHVTLELTPRWSSGNYHRPAKNGVVRRQVRANHSLGKSTTVFDWPAWKKSVEEHDPKKDLNLGTLRVAEDRWESVRTGFHPKLHGFSFENTDRSVCWGPTCKGEWKNLFSTRQALCGGMSLTALERFAAGRCDTYDIEVPEDDPMPAQLKKEIVTNQLETFFLWRSSLKNNPYANAIASIMKTPITALPTSTPGWRFFEWQAKTDRPNQQVGNTIGASSKIEWLQKIKPAMDARKLPFVLGLVRSKAAKFNLMDIDLLTKNHQVLVIGYDHNPLYRAVTLYIYDPNKPGEVQELKFNYKLRKSRMYIDYTAGQPVRGFFQMAQLPAHVGASPCAKQNGHRKK